MWLHRKKRVEYLVSADCSLGADDDVTHTLVLVLFTLDSREVLRLLHSAILALLLRQMRVHVQHSTAQGRTTTW